MLRKKWCDYDWLFVIVNCDRVPVADVFSFSVRPPRQGEGMDHTVLMLSSVAAVAAEVERMIVLSTISRLGSEVEGGVS